MGLCHCAYPRDFGRYKNNRNGRNKCQSGSDRANRPERVFLYVKTPSEPIYDPLASEKTASYEQGEHEKPHPNRGDEACPGPYQSP
jgi:hypothetical protein